MPDIVTGQSTSSSGGNPEITLKEYLDRAVAELQRSTDKAEITVQRAIEAAQKGTQAAIDKAEHTVQLAVDKAEEAALRGVNCEREVTEAEFETIRQRFVDIDRATSLPNDTVNRAPTDAQTAVRNLGGIIDERFESIRTQFKERDTRQERESRDNRVAVDAALSAQKEAAAKQEETFKESIGKSEKGTAETIAKLQALTSSQDNALSDKIDDIKERVQRIESTKVGSDETKDRTGLAVGSVIAAAVFVVLVVGLIISITSGPN